MEHAKRFPTAGKAGREDRVWEMVEGAHRKILLCKVREELNSPNWKERGQSKAVLSLRDGDFGTRVDTRISL